MANAHVAVTGAAGFIGSRLIKEINREHPNWRITAVDNYYLGNISNIGGINVEHIDIRHRNRLETALENVDVVVHLAAISGVDDCTNQPDLAYETNVVGTSNVAYLCKKLGTAMIFPFSMAVIGNPVDFPVTTDAPRNPLNWYGKTKVLGESTVDNMAHDEFSATQFMISNLYGQHTVNDKVVSKGTVINFFVEQALSGDPLTVYEPGSQSRNFVHVNDVAIAFRLGVEQLLKTRKNGTIQTNKYEIASNEDLSVMNVAKMVSTIANEERGLDVDIELTENPRSGETLTDRFHVDTSSASRELNWEPERTVEESIRNLLAI